MQREQTTRAVPAVEPSAGAWAPQSACRLHLKSASCCLEDLTAAAAAGNGHHRQPLSPQAELFRRLPDFAPLAGMPGPLERHSAKEPDTRASH